MMTDEDTQQREVRIPFRAAPDEIKAIDDFRYSQRIPSRSEALRRLLRMGLKTHGESSIEHGSQSKDEPSILIGQMK